MVCEWYALLAVANDEVRLGRDDLCELDKCAGRAGDADTVNEDIGRVLPV